MDQNLPGEQPRPPENQSEKPPERPKPKRKLFEKHPEVDKDINRALFMVRHGRQFRILAVVIAILVVAGIAGYIIYEVVVPPPECTLDEQCAKGYYCHEEKCEEIPTEKPPEDLSIQIENTSVFPSIDGKVDLLAVIKDPDARWGITDMTYTFVVTDAGGNEVGRAEGDTYILPGEQKDLVVMGVPVTGAATSATLTLETKAWVKSPEAQQPEIEVKNVTFRRDGNVGTAQLDGRLINSSKYNFEEVEITVILEDSNGNPVGTNYTTLNALIPGEERDFRLLWFGEVPADVATQTVKVEANIYDTTNFLHLMNTTPEEFQLYEEPED